MNIQSISASTPTATLSTSAALPQSTRTEPDRASEQPIDRYTPEDLDLDADDQETSPDLIQILKSTSETQASNGPDLRDVLSSNTEKLQSKIPGDGGDTDNDTPQVKAPNDGSDTATNNDTPQPKTPETRDVLSSDSDKLRSESAETGPEHDRGGAL